MDERVPTPEQLLFLLTDIFNAWMRGDACLRIVIGLAMEQAKHYVGMLKLINAVGMSASILTSVNDADPKIREKARAELAALLLRMYSHPHPRGTRTA